MSDGLDGMGFMALRRRCAELGATPSQVDALMGKPAALALATRLTHQRQLADAEKADKLTQSLPPGLQRKDIS